MGWGLRLGVVTSVLLWSAQTSCSKKADTAAAPKAELAAGSTDAAGDAAPTHPASDTPAVAPDAASPAVPADVTAVEPRGSLAATCAEITRVTDAAFAKVEAQKKAANGKPAEGQLDIVPRQGVGTCVEGPGGAYAIEVTDGTYTVEDAGDGPIGGSSMQAKLVFVAASGTRTELAVGAGALSADGADFGADTMFTGWWRIEAVHDWSGDGQAEVALTREYSRPADTGTFVVLFELGTDETTKARTLEAWTPVGPDTTIEKVGDEDGDGRLDLYSRQPFHYSTPNADVPFRAAGLQVFHHAKPDGTFEVGGDAAKAYYRKACGDKAVTMADLALPKAGNAGENMGALLSKAICARLYGAKKDAILGRVTPLMQKLAEDPELSASDEDSLDAMPVSLAE